METLALKMFGLKCSNVYIKSRTVIFILYNRQRNVDQLLQIILVILYITFWHLNVSVDNVKLPTNRLPRSAIGPRCQREYQQLSNILGAQRDVCTDPARSQSERQNVYLYNANAIRNFDKISVGFF